MDPTSWAAEVIIAQIFQAGYIFIRDKLGDITVQVLGDSWNCSSIDRLNKDCRKLDRLFKWSRQSGQVFCCRRRKDSGESGGMKIRIWR